MTKMKIGNKEIQYVEKSKVLGIIIDQNLSFLHHSEGHTEKMLAPMVQDFQKHNQNTWS